MVVLIGGRGILSYPPRESKTCINLFKCNPKQPSISQRKVRMKTCIWVRTSSWRREAKRYNHWQQDLSLIQWQLRCPLMRVLTQEPLLLNMNLKSRSTPSQLTPPRLCRVYLWPRPQAILISKTCRARVTHYPRIFQIFQKQSHWDILNWILRVLELHPSRKLMRMRRNPN